eukprot:8041448-Lingulodinium_polyedra.AAC.1
MTGDELLSQLSHDAWTDPTTGRVHEREEAGATVLLQALHREYAQNQQDQSIAALDAFFGHERQRLSL